VTRYEWDLDGDGTTDSTGDGATFTYEEGGEYEVTLTVTGEYGGTDTATRTLTVEAADTGSDSDAGGLPGFEVGVAALAVVVALAVLARRRS
jgi:MYXO-CTERM domain-containing protein